MGGGSFCCCCFVVAVVILYLECERLKLKRINLDIFSISKETLISKCTATYCFTVDFPEGDFAGQASSQPNSWQRPRTLR